jgi:hypothetical protein
MNPYFMGFCAPVVESRVNEFLHNKLDTNEIAVLFQDLIEAGAIPILVAQVSERFYAHAQYYADLGWCHLSIRPVH